MAQALVAVGPTLLDSLVDPSACPAVTDVIRGPRPRALAE